MLYAIFPAFVNMSITAAAVILIVAVLRPLLRRTPRSITFLLWAAAFFRLVCPISVSSAFSLFRSAQTVDSRIQVLPSALLDDTLHLSEAQPSTVIAETITEAASGSLGRTDFVKFVMVVGTWIWILGILAFLVTNGIALFRLHRKCIGAVEIEKRVYLADGIQTPFVLGVLRPKIYLPSALTEAEQQDILLHEQMHIWRLDPLWKLLAFLALTLHWFNPIVWLGFHLFVQDMETACDEHVLRGMDQNARADYAETLLRLSTGRRFPAVSPAFGEDSPKARIKSILRYKKPLRIVTAFAAAAAVFIAVLLIANPQTETGRAGDIIPEFPHFKTLPTHFSYHQEASRDHSEHTETHENTVGAYAVYSVMRNLTIEAVPANESRAEDRERAYTYSIGTANGMTNIHFDRNFKHMWVDNGVKPSYTYKVKDTHAANHLWWIFSYTNYDQPFSAYEDFTIDNNDYSTVIYRPAMEQNSGSIQVGVLQNAYINGYFLTKFPGVLHSDSVSNSTGLKWIEISAPKNTPSSPESIEFILDDNFRIQIWKDPALAVLRWGDVEIWHEIPEDDYESAVELLFTYALTPAEVQEKLETKTPDDELPAEAETSASPDPSATPSPTRTPETDTSVQSASAPTSTPQPTPETTAETE